MIRIDASIDDGSLGRLVNDDHTKPNTFMKVLIINDIPHLVLYSKRPTAAGEELRYCYGDGVFPW